MSPIDPEFVDVYADVCSLPYYHLDEVNGCAVAHLPFTPHTAHPARRRIYYHIGGLSDGRDGVRWCVDIFEDEVWVTEGGPTGDPIGGVVPCSWSGDLARDCQMARDIFDRIRTQTLQAYARPCTSVTYTARGLALLTWHAFKEWEEFNECDHPWEGTPADMFLWGQAVGDVMSDYSPHVEGLTQLGVMSELVSLLAADRDRLPGMPSILSLGGAE